MHFNGCAGRGVRVKIPTPSAPLRAGSNVAKNATLGWGTLGLRILIDFSGFGSAISEAQKFLLVLLWS